MHLVWWVFETLAVVLAAAGLLALARSGPRAPVFQTVGRWLLVLAGATAIHPTLLETVGPWIWAGGYAGIVAAVTVTMTIRSVRAARRLAAAHE